MPKSTLLQYRNLIVPVTVQIANPATWRRYPAPREVRLICIHCSQGHEVATGAEGLAAWGAKGKGHPEDASWHFAVDSDSVTQSVYIDDIAWHAGPINGYSVGIEQVGRAEQTVEQWHDAYSRSVIATTARLVAILAGMYDLPIEHVSRDLPRARGVCTHHDVTMDLCKGRGHWDPGPNYPMEEMLAMARAFQLEAVRNWRPGT